MRSIVQRSVGLGSACARVAGNNYRVNRACGTNRRPLQPANASGFKTTVRDLLTWTSSLSSWRDAPALLFPLLRVRSESLKHL